MVHGVPKSERLSNFTFTFHNNKSNEKQVKESFQHGLSWLLCNTTREVLEFSF